MKQGQLQGKGAGKPVKPVCGARTRTCRACSHHQKQHKGGGACACGCRKFDPKLCQNDKLIGGTGKRSKPRCKLHGGQSPKGAASPNWKHGLRSTYMPAALGGDYHQALHDPSLTSIREDLAMVELLQRQLLRGHLSKKQVTFTLAERKELADLADLRQRLISAEARRVRDLSLAIPAERVRAMGTSLVQATRDTFHRLHKAGVLTIDPNVALRDLQTLWLQLQGVNRLPAAADTEADDEPTAAAS